MLADSVYVDFPGLRPLGITYCRIHLNRLIARGEFPAPRQLSANRVAWRLCDVRAWMDSRPVATWAATARDLARAEG
jgi:predicted DNA-binding transcriptional regulator AlpA